MSASTFGGQLKQLRRERGLATRGLAEAAGVGRSSINRYESGRTAPNASTVARLANALSVEPGDLLTGSARSMRATAHNQDVFKLLNVAQTLSAARLATLTEFARFLYKQQRQSKDHTRSTRPR